MNQFGELFTAELPEATLPMLYSPEDKGREMAQRFITVNAWLRGLPLELSELTEDASGSWRIELKGGFRSIDWHRRTRATDRTVQGWFSAGTGE